MNKADEEIIEVMKEIFFNKSSFFDPDDHLRKWMIRVMAYLSVLIVLSGIIIRIAIGKIDSGIATIASFQLIFFFGMLGMYLNSRSENSSLILWLITAISMFFGFYFGTT